MPGNRWPPVPPHAMTTRNGLVWFAALMLKSQARRLPRTRLHATRDSPSSLPSQIGRAHV
jgi:hypothetical protein